GLKTGHNLPRVHPRLEDLQGDFATDRLILLGHEDDAEAALPDLLQELVRADHRASACTERLFIDGDNRAGRRSVQKAACVSLSGQHLLDAPAKVRISRAGLVEIGRTLLCRALLQGRKEDGLEWRRNVHGSLAARQSDRRPAIPSPKSQFFCRVMP